MHKLKKRKYLKKIIKNKIKVINKKLCIIYFIVLLLSKKKILIFTI